MPHLFDKIWHRYLLHFLLILLVSFSTWKSHSTTCVEAAKNTNQLESSLLDLSKRAKTVYSEAQGPSGELLFLGQTEYRMRLLKSNIPSNAILVLKEIPLDVDIPLVAGIIIGTPLTMQGTHIQIQAKMLGIPLVYVQDLSINDLKEFSEKSGHLSLTTEESVHLEKNSKKRTRRKFESSLPTPHGRESNYRLVSPLDVNVLDQSTNVIGNKFR